ncbi:MAG TPA: DUF5681 domain-containing protein [Verrucomicrobiota bacterium]|nr:DUF5681 domain-containing protein [Verrucomicrobiota bacterium]
MSTNETTPAPEPGATPVSVQEQRKSKRPGGVTGRGFMPGCSGNPSGRRKGVASVQAALRRTLTPADATAIAKQLIAKAKEGNTTATKLLLNHMPTSDQNGNPLDDLLGRL